MRGIKKPEGDAGIKKQVKPLRINISPYLKPVSVKPYTGADNLTDPVQIEEGNPLKLSEPRFFLTGYPETGFKFIAVYKKEFKGRIAVCRSLVKVIKPRKRNKPGEKALLKKLKDLGIPGAY